MNRADKPILAGVLPLVSSRHANFLHHEVPGIFIPDATRQRIEDGGVRVQTILVGSEAIRDNRLNQTEVGKGPRAWPRFSVWDLREVDSQ